MDHKTKLRIANAMPRSKDDIKYNRGKFDTDAWRSQKDAIAARVERKQSSAHKRAIDRKKKK